MTKRTAIKCPYKYTSKNKCTHKEAGDDCVFNSPINCPIFIQWMDKVDNQIKIDCKYPGSLIAP